MSHTEPRTNSFAMAVVIEAALALLAVGLAWLAGIQLRDQFPPWGDEFGRAVVRGLVATLPLLVIFWLLVHSNWPAFRQLSEQVDWLIGEMFPNAGIGQFAMVAALAGVGEELLFRGVIQTKLIDWTNAPIGLILASLLFGVMHALSKTYFLLATLIGLFFGWLTFHYHDLVAPIVSHALYDFVALTYIARSRRSRLTSGDQKSEDR